MSRQLMMHQQLTVHQQTLLWKVQLQTVLLQTVLLQELHIPMVHREVQTVRMKDTNLHRMDTTMVWMGITINMVISIPIKHKKE